MAEKPPSTEDGTGRFLLAQPPLRLKEGNTRTTVLTVWTADAFAKGANSLRSQGTKKARAERYRFLGLRAAHQITLLDRDRQVANACGHGGVRDRARLRDGDHQPSLSPNRADLKSGVGR